MSTTAKATLKGRVDALDWDQITRQLDGRGFAVTERLLESTECDDLGDANEWSRRLRGDEEYPLEHSELLEICHAGGQDRPTPLILRYGEGDWNALHQDLYGDVYFPFQILTILSRPGVDFEGGEFVLVEQRPRAQSRAHVISPPQGAFVIFPTHHRPNLGKSGYHRVGLRHGVSTLTSGSRTALGVIFHDAR